MTRKENWLVTSLAVMPRSYASPLIVAGYRDGATTVVHATLFDDGRTALYLADAPTDRAVLLAAVGEALEVRAVLTTEGEGYGVVTEARFTVE